MKLKKPNFWDYKKPNILAYILLPFAFLIQILKFFKTKTYPNNFKIKTICVHFLSTNCTYVQKLKTIAENYSTVVLQT